MKEENDYITVIERKVIEFADTINRGSEERAYLRKALEDIYRLGFQNCEKIYHKRSLPNNNL